MITWFFVFFLVSYVFHILHHSNPFLLPQLAVLYWSHPTSCKDSAAPAPWQGLLTVIVPPCLDMFITGARRRRRPVRRFSAVSVRLFSLFLADVYSLFLLPVSVTNTTFSLFSSTRTWQRPFTTACTAERKLQREKSAGNMCNLIVTIGPCGTIPMCTVAFSYPRSWGS